MIVHEKRKRPLPWQEWRARCPHPSLVPFFAFDWIWEWIAYLLSHWNFLEVLEYLGSFSVLIAVIFYFREAPDRIKQKHYQAWQVINTAQGKGGSGGRIEALEELNRDGISLIGVDLSHAFLQLVRLEHAQLSRADLTAADARQSTLDGSDLSFAEMQSANLRGSRLRQVSLERADLRESDLNSADLSKSDLTGADLTDADLRNADLSNIEWKQIKSVKNADIFGVKRPPDGFLEWALRNGALQAESDDAWRSASR
jgi:Pentapeptide repeats (8 copies)